MRPSRMWLVAEIYGALVAFCFAWVGSGLWPFERAYLFNRLDLADLDKLWTVSIGVPAVFLLAVSMREFAIHRWQSRTPGRALCEWLGIARGPVKPWTIIDLDRSARLRGWAAFALMFSWLYMFYALCAISRRPSAVMPIAILGVIFMGLSWLENRRVQRDVRRQTGVFSAPAR